MQSGAAARVAWVPVRTTIVCDAHLPLCTLPQSPRESSVMANQFKFIVSLIIGKLE